MLSIASVVIYDALVDPELLQLAPPNCLKLDVGKRGGRPSTPQQKINQLLIAYCLQGKQVIRLKSGDPFIFGRSSEEIQALSAAGCDFEIIPGVSSAIAAPTLAGIPLTDRIFSTCFAVLSAHDPDKLDWEALARIDTLVILMGGRNLERIVQQLKDNGRSPLTPAAIIRDCSRPSQQVWSGTLEDIVNKTSGVSLSPAVIVVGEVVKLADNLQLQQQHKPLASKTILVTRAAGQSAKFTDLLQQQGANVIEIPALEIRPPSSWEGLDRAIDRLQDFHWLILTSANGVEYFFKRLTNLGKNAVDLAQIKIAVVGKKTAATLKKQGLRADFIPPDFVADSLVENFPEALTNKKILFPRVETGGRAILVKELSAAGAEIVEVAAYESGCPKEIDAAAWEAIQKKQVDIITFASSKTVRNFAQLIESAKGDNSARSLLEGVTIASIGPQTSQSCREILGRVDIEASVYTLEGLTEAILGSVGKGERGRGGEGEKDM